jgi:hypothetical protein
MRDLSQLADQIRRVRDAERRFMGLWRIEQVLIGPDVLDRLAADMAAAHRELDADGADSFHGGMLGGGYPAARDWSMYSNGGADGLT